MKILKTGNAVYVVNLNEDGKLTILKDGKIFQDAGMLIKTLGGIESVLARCVEYTNEEWQAKLDTEKAERKAREEARSKREKEQHLMYKAEYEKVFGKGGIVEATYENVCVLLKYLHGINHGLWPNLPKMTIEYKCGQYDCDFVTATVISLNKPIEVDGEKISKLCIGGKPGFLLEYTKILF